MKTVAFFNNKGGVGKTSLVYHLAHMYAESGRRVLAVDLDPQANLTSMFLNEERLVELWEGDAKATITESLQPIRERTGLVQHPHIEPIAEGLGLIPGNLALAQMEDLMSENWGPCIEGRQDALRVVSSFYRVIDLASQSFSPDLVLIDVGPNLGAINRAALISVEHVVVPLAPDLFSLQGLRNLGPTLRQWRANWKLRLDKAPDNLRLELPGGQMQPIGYVVMQHGMRDNRPVRAYQRWMDRIPETYRNAVLNEPSEAAPPVADDPYRLALLKHYRSLMPLAMDARKPMFSLRPADGAIGAHVEAVRNCHRDFGLLAVRIYKQIS